MAGVPDPFLRRQEWLEDVRADVLDDRVKSHETTLDVESAFRASTEQAVDGWWETVLF